MHIIQTFVTKPYETSLCYYPTQKAISLALHITRAKVQSYPWKVWPIRWVRCTKTQNKESKQYSSWPSYHKAKRLVLSIKSMIHLDGLDMQKTWNRESNQYLFQPSITQGAKVQSSLQKVQKYGPLNELDMHMEAYIE